MRRLYPQARYRAAVQQIAVPLPQVGGKNLAAERIRDDDLLQWVADLITGVKGLPRISLDPPRPEESPADTPAQEPASLATSSSTPRRKGRSHG